MRRRPVARHICPSCGSVAVHQRGRDFVCGGCGHAARKFPLSTDPVPCAETWDGRPRISGQVLPIRSDDE